MKNLVLLLLLLALPTVLIAQHVFYGERALEGQETAVYFDKDGFPYPDYFISDSSMVSAYGSLFTWFQQNNAAFIDLSARYQLFPEAINQKTIFQLRDSITAGIARDLNKKAEGSAGIAFYLHGFRKSFVAQNNDVTSAEEFQLLKNDLRRYHQPEALEVLVFWDGMYGCCFSKNRKRNRELFALYEEAAGNARDVGLGFRSLLTQIKSDTLQFVAHSLGAQVITSSLFNIHHGPGETFARKELRVCLIAPAAEGRTFREYYAGNPPGKYHLMIVYNDADFVLKKKDPKVGLFGPGPKRYGKTTLGCNWHNDAVKLQRFVSKHPHTDLVLLDMTRVGKCHSLRCYTKEDYLKEVSLFLWAGR